MQSSIPEDYTKLLEQYVKLKQDFEEAKQNLYDTTRQLKLKDALVSEYQGDIEILQNNEKSENLKYESRISNLEETVANLRLNHLQNITVLESELLQKSKEAEDLKIELEHVKKINSSEEQHDISLKSNDLIKLSSENEQLKLDYEELQCLFKNVRLKQFATEEALQEYKEQVKELRKSLQVQKEELLEKTELIDKLNEEILCVTNDLEVYKDKPLQEDSKGNSLFAEVEDRRRCLQKTVNDMKSNYIHLKQERLKNEKIISHLRKENADLRALWKKDLEQIDEDHNEVMDSLNSRLRVLEEINKKQQLQLEECTKPSNDVLCTEYQFYQDIIESKSSEIKMLEKKLSDRFVTEHMLSVSLAQAHKELRLLRLSMLDLQQQMEKNKENFDLSDI